MELEEAINKLKFISITDVYGNEIRIENEAARIVIQHLTKQEKMIEMMCYAMTHEDIPQNEYCIFRTVDCEVVGGNKSCTECMRKYFEKKAEESE